MLISVIIPCYNVEDYIRECLDSVFTQTYQYLEVIVVNNNCTDSTIDIVKSYTNEKDVSISIVTEERQGLSHARNAGITIAKGNWIQFLDADDLLLPDKIKKQVEVIEEGFGLVIGPNIERAIDGKEIIIYPINHFPLGIILGYRSLGSSCSNLWHKESINNVGNFNEHKRSSEEYDLLFRLYKSGVTFCIENNPLTIIRKRPNGQMSSWSKKILSKDWLELRKEQLNYFLLEKVESFSKEQFQEIGEKVHLNLVHLFSEDYLLAEKYYNEVFRHFFSLNSFPLRSKICLYYFLYSCFGFVFMRKSFQKINEYLNHHSNTKNY